MSSQSSWNGSAALVTHFLRPPTVACMKKSPDHNSLIQIIYRLSILNYNALCTSFNANSRLSFFNPISLFGTLSKGLSSKLVKLVEAKAGRFPYHRSDCGSINYSSTWSCEPECRQRIHLFWHFNYQFGLAMLLINWIWVVVNEHKQQQLIMDGIAPIVTHEKKWWKKARMRSERRGRNDAGK